MEFTFRYRVRPANLLLLAMVNVYRSMAGVVNIVFTLSMILLEYRFWAEINAFLRVLIALGILLFPFFQPLFIYLRGRKIVSRMPDDLEMRINAKGIEIVSAKGSSQVKMSDLKSVTRIRGLIVLYARNKQGFILNGETLSGKGPELYAFLSKRAGKR